MSIINNILNDEYGLVYDSSNGRIYQKEVTWECDNEKPDIMPDWFKRWTQTQQMNTGSVPRWFLDWLNRMTPQFQPNQMLPQIPSQFPGQMPSPNDMPSWFKDWLQSQYLPYMSKLYPNISQSTQPTPPTTMTPYPGSTYPPGVTYPQGVYPQGVYPQGVYPQGVYPQGVYPQVVYPQTLAPTPMPSTYPTPVIVQPTTIPNTPVPSPTPLIK